MKDMDLYTDVFKRMLDISDIEELKLAHLDETDTWTSFVHLKIITELEQTFCVEFDAKDIMEFRSFAAGIDILKRKGVWEG